jgi:hypothetical protein
VLTGDALCLLFETYPKRRRSAAGAELEWHMDEGARHQRAFYNYLFFSLLAFCPLRTLLSVAAWASTAKLRTAAQP